MSYLAKYKLAKHSPAYDCDIGIVGYCAHSRGTIKQNIENNGILIDGKR